MYSAFKMLNFCVRNDAFCIEMKGNGIRDEAALVLSAALRGRKLPKIAHIDLSDNQVRATHYCTFRMFNQAPACITTYNYQHTIMQDML